MPTHFRIISKEELLRELEALKKGDSIRTIAKHLGCTHPSLLDKMKRFGIKIEPSFDVINNNIEETTTELLEKNNIKQAPVDIEKIAKTEDLKVIKSADFEQDLSGMIVNNTVYVNKNMSSSRNRFTIAHELGHYLLHNLEEHKYKPVRFRADGIPTEEQQREQEANRFAAELLMPRSFLENKLKNKKSITEDDIDDFSKEFKVSILAMSYRLDNLGFSL